MQNPLLTTKYNYVQNETEISQNEIDPILENTKKAINIIRQKSVSSSVHMKSIDYFVVFILGSHTRTTSYSVIIPDQINIQTEDQKPQVIAKKKLKRLPNGQYSLTINLQEIQKDLESKQKSSVESLSPFNPTKKIFKNSNLHRKYESLIGVENKENISVNANHVKVT